MGNSVAFNWLFVLREHFAQCQELSFNTDEHISRLQKTFLMQRGPLLWPYSQSYFERGLPELGHLKLNLRESDTEEVRTFENVEYPNDLRMMRSSFSVLKVLLDIPIRVEAKFDMWVALDKTVRMHAGENTQIEWSLKL